jgi:hypothetical protein
MSSDAPQTLDGQRLFVSARDYIEEVIIPALGNYADDYDLDSVASEMLERHETVRDGMVDTNHSGLREREDVDFWEVIARHDTLARAASAAEEVDRLEAALAGAREVEQQAAREAVEAGATRYRVAQVMGRSQPTIKRWVP